MKEIWMEKLIRFINEYGHTSNCWPFETCRIELATEWNSSYLLLSRDDNWEWDWKKWMVSIPRLISKEYGFIKWLVENDKIDLDMVREKLWTPCFTWYKKWEIIAVKDVEDYKHILMLLAISDTPIDDLILYLK